MNVHNRRAEVGDGAYRAGHRVGNVVELEIEKDRQAEFDDGADSVGAVRGEEFEPGLHPADMAPQRLGPVARLVEIGGVEGREYGICGQLWLICHDSAASSRGPSAGHAHEAPR